MRWASERAVGETAAIGDRMKGLWVATIRIGWSEEYDLFPIIG